MLKVYICPKCGLVRFVSKFKTECFRCNCQMTLAKISYENYILLDTKQRKSIIEKICVS